MPSPRVRLPLCALLLCAALTAFAVACSQKDAGRAAPGAGGQAAIIVPPASSPAAAGTASVATAPVAARKRLVFLGDSLTAGYNLPAAQAFPARIEARLRADGLPFDVVNAGVSGDTSAGGLRRLDWLFRAPVDVLYVCLGANDGLRGQPLDALEKNLREIVSRARARGAHVVLAGMRLPRNYGGDFRGGFDEVFGRVATSLQVPLLPFLLEGVAGDPALNQADGLHPTAEGAERVAAHVYTHLSPILRKRLQR